MALTKTSWAVVAFAVAVAMAISSPLVEAQTPNNACAVSLMPFVTNCFLDVSASPTAECCGMLKAATTTQVRCICDTYVNHNSEYANLTQPILTGVFNQCGLPDKLSCGGSGTGTGGGADRVSSMGLIGLFASLFLIIFY
ncbi:PREDICTED: uncharacterized protein LOC104813776 [Tarenaya hassleriana]|uniref:uncharacterized protein LOC104813776 n=1 Tax=Tarenaya hassleriana TaxID=28532 RepID=UPI00053C734E|nr:PREDICTED: uncharacterized protein LOC104813776 [Tarenaya hassleriana]